MRKLLYILLFISLRLSAQDIGGDYYISSTGDDDAAGTYAAPWETFGKAFSTAVAGDTVYARGGVYYTTDTETMNGDGEWNNYICIFNYPGETPTIDGINMTADKQGILFSGASYVHIKGITVRNILQKTTNLYASGIYAYQSNGIIVENCVAHDIGVRAFQISQSDSVFMINCDAYNVVDSLSATPGNAGDGFIAYDGHADADTANRIFFRGCRAWQVSDDGWDVHTEGYVEIDSCWAFKCGGYEDYNYGNGFKLNLSVSVGRSILSRKITNCLSVYNRGNGITTNDNNAEAIPMHIYNNTSAYNGTFGNSGSGFSLSNTSGTDAEELERVFRNNVSYANTNLPISIAGNALYTHSNNTWDDGFSVSASDFISVDSTGIQGARQSDGSLPTLTYFQLASTSDLIDAGIDVGLPFNNTAPDLGWAEYIQQFTTPIRFSPSGSPIFRGGKVVTK